MDSEMLLYLRVGVLTLLLSAVSLHSAYAQQTAEALCRDLSGLAGETQPVEHSEDPTDRLATIEWASASLLLPFLYQQMSTPYPTRPRPSGGMEFYQWGEDEWHALLGVRSSSINPRARRAFALARQLLNILRATAGRQRGWDSATLLRLRSVWRLTAQLGAGIDVFVPIARACRGPILVYGREPSPELRAPLSGRPFP